MEKRTDIERAAWRNRSFRGLEQVVAGAMLLLLPAVNWWGGHVESFWLAIAPFGLVLLAYLAIHRHYDERYGHVTPSRRGEIPLMVAGIVVPIILLPAIRAQLPVNVVVIMAAVAGLVVTAARTGLERHHVAVYGTLLVAGALPVWSGVDTLDGGLVVVGIAIIVNGILDHRLLVREFGPAHTPALGDGDARA
jgi:hypothetical protein